ncbi:hypothetical protein CWI85_12470, partial [Streptomyces albidoflavus]
RAAAGVAVAVAGAALWTLGATGGRTGAGREGVRELAPLWSGDFWPGLLLVGPVAALLLLLLVRVGAALLHVVRERLRVPGGGPGTELPVCSLCSDYLRLPFVSPSPGLLLLPGPRRTRVPYLEAAGPLPAVHGGLDALVREIKETPVRTGPSRVRDRPGLLLVASAALGLAAVVALAGQAGAGGSVNWLVPLPLFVGAAIGAVYVRRHPGERRAEPRTVFTTAEEAAFVRMRDKAAELLPELGLLIAEAPVALPGGTPGMERALDAYAAAGTVLDGARDLADL